ncbi:histidine kinase [Pseudomonas fluorescens]|jgi:transmembrane sensor|uniref:FecR family protein n=2 Tax=Pseudomonas TaxID=286 RepID=A0A1B3CQ21_PSEFL|nr:MULTISPECIES: FecR family protein [Pseudomonas]AHC34630.1 histidine kinase [Pseudomonas sp. TKP]AOE67142.1 histidine kinase [Pseudomonas fluorescens]AOE72956.1 histidine kinase [Pseudomonas fluorescens]MBL1310262.1 FecR family protein [Pseudomonas sp.]PMX13848.1 FecR family protein [Pseudomonas sp. MPBC4-3]
MPDTRQHIEEQAAEWQLQLHEGPLSEAQRLAFESWKQQGPRYAAAAARMEAVIVRVQALRETKSPARAALDAAFADKPSRRNKHAMRTLLLACSLALPAAALLISPYPQRWMADVRNGPGQWQTLHLADGSALTLNGISAANLHFDATQRRIDLLQGEILVEVAHDPARPFIVQTAQGTLRALGTRFVVKREDDVTVLSMLESRVAAQSANAQQTLEVDAGSQALVSANSVRLAGRIDPASINDAWRRHQLVVENRPLPEVLDEIARHRAGHLQFDRAALQNLRVSAVIPLDDSDHALQLLAQTLPIKVYTYTPWLIRVALDKTPNK